MSASESESGSAELLDATPAASTSRRSNRIAAQSESASQIRETLRARGITPAPGLELSQLQDLASNGVVCETPVRVQRPASSGPAAAPGRKRTRKTHHLAPQAKRKRASAVSAPPDHPDAALHAPDVALTSTLQSLVNSMNAIDARLQCLENAQASSSSSAMFSVPPLLHPPAPVMAPAPVPQPSSSFATAPDVPQHSLASAVPAPTIGFRVGVVSSLSSSYVSKNLQSAIQEPDLVSQLLKKELDKGYLIGPFNSSLFPVFRTSPVGIATRKYSGKKRLIVDLSAPRSGPVPSINSLIPPAPFSLHYSTVDNAIKLIKLSGQGAWLSKADITDAFKICPIHPSQWHLFGLKWESKLYFAVRLTFGCRSSPSIFNQVSEALCWIFLNRVRVPSLLHFLDDFLLIDPPHDNSGSSLSKLKLLFQYLGVPLSDEKTSGPATRLEFLGITLDTVEMKASLPAEKLERIREITHSVTAYQEITKQQMLSLLGHLNFAMRVVPQGRSFISRLLDMAASVPNLRDKILLDDGCRSDLKFWSHLLNHWNGVSFFYDDLVYSSDSLKFFTDAAPSVGFGGYFQGQWFASRWPKSFPKVDSSSALYEIYPIAVACHVWGKSWKRKRIAVQCDNEAVVGIINKGRSASREIMPFMRSITWLSVTHNFIITARHVPGRANVIADSLSRFNFQVFKTLCPEASPTPTAVPPLEALALH
ncbi:uncharacterized protein LOC115362289 [Myripristis murdjan]|uniref:uncharacterized protein LOC115362289 n=1 Tax=Myripristis murdjan TaxID=586833 RepID=UPI001176077B|nr:uncharacterized protein LOC115362289 [Myripristis murdjan]